MKYRALFGLPGDMCPDCKLAVVTSQELRYFPLEDDTFLGTARRDGLCPSCWLDRCWNNNRRRDALDLRGWSNPFSAAE